MTATSSCATAAALVYKSTAAPASQKIFFVIVACLENALDITTSLAP
jgi:hypothetical protein